MHPLLLICFRLWFFATFLFPSFLSFFVSSTSCYLPALLNLLYFSPFFPFVAHHALCISFTLFLSLSHIHCQWRHCIYLRTSFRMHATAFLTPYIFDTLQLSILYYVLRCVVASPLICVCGL
ncbi:hypothetical protein B0H14DRAFT_2860373, partial [Mycena olivaceomarginata]